eukprot:jgi/Psemu1/55610/gm1.55610_g
MASSNHDHDSSSSSKEQQEQQEQQQRRYFYDTECKPPRYVRTGIKTFLITPSLPERIERGIGNAVHSVHGIHNLFTLNYTFVRGELKVVLGGHNLPPSWGDGSAFARHIPALQLINRSETTLENFLRGLRKIPSDDGDADGTGDGTGDATGGDGVDEHQHQHQHHQTIPGTTLRIAIGGTAAVELEAKNLLSFGLFWKKAAASVLGWNRDTIILYDLENGWIGTFVDLARLGCRGGSGNNGNPCPCCCCCCGAPRRPLPPPPQPPRPEKYGHKHDAPLSHMPTTHHHRHHPRNEHVLAYNLLCTLKSTLDQTTQLAHKQSKTSPNQQQQHQQQHKVTPKREAAPPPVSLVVSNTTLTTTTTTTSDSDSNVKDDKIGVKKSHVPEVVASSSSNSSSSRTKTIDHETEDHDRNKRTKLN